MPSTTGKITAEQFAWLPDDGQRYELLQGELRMMAPAGGRHGRVTHNLGLLLGSHVRAHGLGTVYAAETGFILSRDPDTVRAPDVAFVERTRFQQVAEETSFVPLAPDLVGEVISPRDSFSAVEAKARDWLAAGVRMVLIVDPENRTLHVYRAPSHSQVLDEASELEADDVVPGWKLPVGELFL